jgi:glutathione peroxidase-family protein
MTEFALYNTLFTNTPSKDLTPAQKTKLVNSIRDLDENATELVYALIKYHHINDKKSSDLYKHTKTNTRAAKSDISWNLIVLPIKLRNILYKFVVLEEQRVEEIESRINTQVKIKNTAGITNRENKDEDL